MKKSIILIFLFFASLSLVNLLSSNTSAQKGAMMLSGKITDIKPLTDTLFIGKIDFKLKASKGETHTGQRISEFQLNKQKTVIHSLKMYCLNEKDECTKPDTLFNTAPITKFSWSKDKDVLTIHESFSDSIFIDQKEKIKR